MSTGVKLLELCTALLVDASGAIRDDDDQVFHSRFGDDPHLIGNFGSLLDHLEQSTADGHVWETFLSILVALLEQ